MAGLCKGPLEVCDCKFKVRRSAWSCAFLPCGVGKELTWSFARELKNGKMISRGYYQGRSGLSWGRGEGKGRE